MGFLFKWIALILCLTSCVPVDSKTRSAESGNDANVQLQEARAYSFIIRDQGPSAEELSALMNGSTRLSDLLQTWMASPAHRSRMLRYFDDMMGYRDVLPLLQPNARLNRNADGIYYAPRKGDCKASEAMSGEAWWLPEGTTARFCPNIMATELSMTVDGQTIVCAKGGRTGFLHPACGCGPDRIHCIAPEEANRLLLEVQHEFAERALQVYQSNQSWLDLLAAPEFFGTRRLYWLYFQNQSMFDVKLYTEEALRTLENVPLDKPETRPYPKGAERSGIATAPGFLVQYNNFRSRVAGLTRSFLCQDVNPTLNTDGIQSFVNPSLTANDRAHGEKVDCASCHYALDNLGGALMPWTDRGVFQPKLSTLTHAFGQTGEGPAFLMRSLVERGPGFEDCMARRAWEDFTSLPWVQTDESIKTKVRSWVAAGPQSLIQNLLTSAELKQALAGTASSDPDSDLDPEVWASMQPILKQSCSGGSCHSSGARQPAYADLSSLWISDREKLRDRLQRNGPGRMPPPSRPLTDEDREFLLQNIL